MALSHDLIPWAGKSAGWAQGVGYSMGMKYAEPFEEQK